MSLRSLGRLLAVYTAVLVTLCLLMRAHGSLHELAPSEARVVVSRWRDGHRFERMSTAAGSFA